ncbi:FAM13A isoform X1 [Brachionus plicatilis]|uniref:FAM13A isoform X1 n=1 Tax=Brachionus plicatilis TaxID=10195 RepID=A0A3M7REY0_BRAPC|nr:FAM13A isoform X1 [Brachionus plicatilis]
MKFSDSKHDSIYDEFDNSIVDSLSELSIASTLQLNPSSKEAINRTISDVISTYLWTSDLRQPCFNDSRKKTKKYEKVSNFEHENLDLIKINDRASCKMAVPTLDFSSFTEKEPKTDEIHNRKDRNSFGKPKSQENILTTKQESTRNSIDIKLKGSESNLKPEFHSHANVKHDIESLLYELKLLKNNIESSEYYNQEVESRLSKQEFEKLNSMAVNLRDLLNRLLEKRKIAKRNIVAEKMTREEIQSEKIDTQKELLAFEEKHGRPQTKLEKDLMRPLYDHYRKVKRLLSKYTSSKGVGELKNEENLADEDEIHNIKDNKPFLNLHSLSLNELNKEKEMATLEKLKLKESIKKYEFEFIKSTGRSLTKEDRELHKEEFEKYKFLKAKLKLIDALIEKYEINHFSKAK